MVVQPTPAHPVAMTSQIEATPASSTASPLPAPIFATPRLIVRPLHPQDAPSMSQHANNPRVAEHMSLGFPSPYTLQAANNWISLNQAPPVLHWAICLASAPASVIGGCGLKPGVDVQTHCAEIGIWIGQEYWGRGLGTETIKGLVDWVFGSAKSLLAGEGTRWTRVWPGVFAANKGSQRCFEKCGFVREGVLRGAVEKHGRAIDLVVYGLMRAEWEAKLLRTPVA